MNNHHARNREMTLATERSSLTWHHAKSSQANGNCIECAAASQETILIRDSKMIQETSYPVIAVSATTWISFVNNLKRELGVCDQFNL